MFQLVASSVDDGAAPGLPLIYVSRADIPHGRIMTNERLLSSELQRLGFTSVLPGELTIDQQVHMFSGARVIVGPVGAGLTNMGFAPAGCAVLEIQPSAYRDGWGLHLAGMLGHRYAYVVADVAESRITPTDIGGVVRRDVRFEYEAPVPRVLQAVEGILTASS
jgi:capsular polysaccharide biosynthesis protein